MAQGRGGREQGRHVDSLSAGQTKRQSEGGKIGRGEVGRVPEVGRQSQELSRRGPGLGVAVRAGTEPRGAATPPEGRGEGGAVSDIPGSGVGSVKGWPGTAPSWSGRPLLPRVRRDLPLGKAEAGTLTLGIRETYLMPPGLRCNPAAWTCPRGSGLVPAFGSGGPKAPHLPTDQPHLQGKAPALPLGPPQLLPPIPILPPPLASLTLIAASHGTRWASKDHSKQVELL